MGECKGDGEEVTGYTDQESLGSPGWRYEYKSCSEEGALKARRLAGHLVQHPGEEKQRRGEL